MLPLLTELRHALDMQAALELLVEEGDYCKVGAYIFSNGSLCHRSCTFIFLSCSWHFNLLIAD